MILSIRLRIFDVPSDQLTNSLGNSTARFEKGIFRIGLDYLQNLPLNLHLPVKQTEFNILAKLQSVLGNKISKI